MINYLTDKYIMPPKKQFRIKKPKVTKPTLALVKAVTKKVVAAALEDKYETRLMLSTGYPRYFNTPITANDIFPLLPAISQGTASNERIGDKIRPKKMRVDFTITTNNDTDSSLDVNVRLMVLEDKSIKSTLLLLPQPPSPPLPGNVGSPVDSQLLQYGSALSGYVGIPTDDMARINTERYTVHKDIRRELIKGMGQGPTNANAFLGTQAFISGQQTYKVSVVIPTPAVLKYSQSLDTFPSNFAPFFVLGYVQPDGNAGLASLTQRVAVNYVTHLDFEDA